MRKHEMIAAMLFVLVSCPLQGQACESSGYMDQAWIKHGEGKATLTANAARPLDQAIEALREEYNWILDYEDPEYAGKELTEMNGGDWPVKSSHRRGIMKPAGGAFIASYSESPKMDTDEARSRVLERVIDQYMKSGNPGKFRLVQIAPAQFDIVGLNQNSAPALDAVVTVNVTGKNGLVALDDVLGQVTSKTGHKVGVGFVPTNVLGKCMVAPQVEQGNARTILFWILDSCHRLFTWRLLYNPNTDTYLLNIQLTPTSISSPN